MCLIICRFVEAQTESQGKIKKMEGEYVVELSIPALHLGEAIRQNLGHF